MDSIISKYYKKGICYMMKTYKVIRKILCILLLVFIFILLGKNFDFFKSKFAPESYDRVEARITDITMRYNHFFNLKTEVTYIYQGYEKKTNTYYIIGDSIGENVWLILSNDKIIRNHFVFDWADLNCIVLLGLILYVINKKYKENRLQAVAQYAKKLNQRQIKKASSDIKEVKIDEIQMTNRAIVKKNLATNEIKIGEIAGGKEKAAIILSIILCVIVGKPELYLILLFIFVLFIGASMLTLKDKLKAKLEHKKDIIAEKRTCQLECIVTKVENILDQIEYIEYVRIYCEHITAEGKRYEFKSDKILGITECKKGDCINVLIDPQNYNNYFVQTQGVVHD